MENTHPRRTTARWREPVSAIVRREVPEGSEAAIVTDLERDDGHAQQREEKQSQGILAANQARVEISVGTK